MKKTSNYFIRILILVIFFFSFNPLLVDSVVAEGDDLYEPYIIVLPSGPGMDLWGWELGESVHVTIDDPSTGQTPDFSTDVTIETIHPDANITYRRINLDPTFHLDPGFIVTASDARVTKTHEVIDIHYTDFDLQNDLLFGKGNPNSDIAAWASNNPQNFVYRGMVTDAEGSWMADFSTLSGAEGDTPATLDLKNGSWIGFSQGDEDGDRTEHNLALPNPNFSIRAMTDEIETFEWEIGETITLAIDDPGTDPNPDYSEVRVVEPSPWDPNQSYLSFNLINIIDVQPGFIVSLSGVKITKTIIVTSLDFSSIDVDTDMVSGVADPNITVNIWACSNSGCENRYVTPDSSGIWIADFSSPGPREDENNTVDIIPGTWIDSEQVDDDGDRTMFGLNVSNPHIVVNLGHEWIEAREWPIGTEIIMSVDDPSNGPGIDYSETSLVEQNPNNQGDPSDILALFRWAAQSGFIITMSGNDGQSKTFTVPNLDISSIDLENDIVSGLATPNLEIQIWTYSPIEQVSRYVTSDNFGNWTADFQHVGMTEYEQSTADLTLGMSLELLLINENDDITYLGLSIPNPIINAWACFDQIELRDWKIGQPINVEIDDPGTTQYPDYSDTVIVTGSDLYTSYLSINLKDIFDIQPGFVIGVQQDDIEKSTVVKDLRIQSVDVENDSISGFADPYISVETYVCDKENQCEGRRVTPDQNGFWIADYGHPGQEDEQKLIDLVYDGSFVAVIQLDEDGDGTFYGEYLTPILIDTDNDGVADENDNAPLIFNPHQDDLDADGMADVLDACPNDFQNMCDVDGSAVSVIGTEGGQFTTPNGAVTFIVPSGQFTDWTTISVTGKGSGISLETAEGVLTSIYTGDFQPEGLDFNEPDFAVLILRWSDSNNDGIVDNTNIHENDLHAVRDGVVITESCVNSPEDCDLVNNEFRVLLDHFCTISLAGFQNTAPTITQLNASIYPVAISSLTTADIVFSDPDQNDSHTLVFEWGDGTSSPGTIDELARTGTGYHQYSTSGVYTVTATLSDNHGAESTKDFQFVVVFDPASGFVTGGGWINVPSGSLIRDPLKTGKMNFGFEFKYQKNTVIPLGKTQLIFKTGDFVFESTSYSWMIVSGDKVMISGIGEINGEGGFGFQINAIDGNVYATGDDLIRIRIWDLQTRDTIFDTQPGVFAFADPTLPIGGGSIQIHK